MSIANPMTFYYYTGTNTDWIGSSSDPAYQKRNRWIYISTDAGGTGTITTYYAKGIKTIFDPCPAGWRVPWGQNWTGINTTQSIYNVTFPWSSHGRIWKPNTSNNTTAGSVHYWFPASGFRMPSSGSFNSIGVNGYYWSGSPATNYNMTALYFDSSTANPINNGAQCSRGYLVRPVRE